MQDRGEDDKLFEEHDGSRRKVEIDSIGGTANRGHFVVKRVLTYLRRQRKVTRGCFEELCKYALIFRRWLTLQYSSDRREAGRIDTWRGEMRPTRVGGQKGILTAIHGRR